MLISQPPIAPQNSLVHFYYGLVILSFSFLILVTVWYNYATIVATLPLETRGLVVLNLVLLLVVTFEPYLLYVVAYYGGSEIGEPASVLYAFDLVAMNGILASFAHLRGREDQPTLGPECARKMRTVRTTTLATGRSSRSRRFRSSGRGCSSRASPPELSSGF